MRKYDTVIGTIGKTHGVSSAANPQRIASMIRAQSPLLPTASFAAGAAVSVAGVAGAASMAASAAVPSGRVIVSSVSSGGMQLVSSQIIHSTWALSVASAAVSVTRWANCALPEKVPISIWNIWSK